MKIKKIISKILKKKIKQDKKFFKKDNYKIN